MSLPVAQVPAGVLAQYSQSRGLFFLLLLYCVIIFVTFFVITVEPWRPTNLGKMMSSCLSDLSAFTFIYLK